MLAVFFDFWYLGGAVDVPPPRFPRPRKVPRKLPRIFTQRQIRKLLTKTRKMRDTALLELLYGAGCRLIEVRNLRLEDIDLAERNAATG
jgi:site-specific recombinase XerD